MRRSSGLAALALTATALTGSPAFADTAEYAGFSCGFIATNDPTGMITQDPNVRYGEIDCGPVVAADVLADDGSGPSPHPGPAHVEICGWIQVNSAAYGERSYAGVCGSGDVVVHAVNTVFYVASYADDVYVCTETAISHPGDPDQVVRYDEDGDPANGAQCALSVTGEG